jgi:tetratricopeptide (TPR) repeat protein
LATLGLALLGLGVVAAAQTPPTPLGTHRDHDARALVDLAQGAEREGRVGEALEFLVEALAIYRGTGNRAGTAATQAEIGRINNAVFNYEAAVARLTEAATIYREIGARPELARVNLALGRSQMMLGRRLDAIQLFEDALAEFTRIGDTRLAEETRTLLNRVK